MGENRNCLKRTFERGHMESGPSNIALYVVLFINTIQQETLKIILKYFLKRVPKKIVIS